MAYGPKPKPRGIFKPEDVPPWNCVKCKRTLPISSYYPSNTSSYGYLKKCRQCHNSDSKAHRERLGPEHFRRAHLLKNFNLTQEAYEEMLAWQGGVCGACRAPEPGGHGTWHVDHDHACCPEVGRSCGRCVRGLLCHHCNLMLGHAKDSVETLAAGIRYLGGDSWLGARSNSIMQRSSLK